MMKPQEQIPRGDFAENTEENLPLFATRKGRQISALILVLIVIFVVASQSNSGSISVAIDDSLLAIACLDEGPEFISLDSITGVELVSTFEQGATLRSEDWDSGWCGVYENEAYGVYTMYAYSATGSYIVVHYEEGVLVFNSRTAKDTNQYYEKLVEASGAVG